MKPRVPRSALVIPAKAGIQSLLVAALLVTRVAAAPSPEGLQQFVQGVDTLTARFEQVQKDDKGHVTQASSGTVALARPGKFRWAYEKPYSQLMVCDGKTLWHYDPDLSQVLVRTAGTTLQGTPAQLLTDRAALEKYFDVETLPPDAGAEHLRLTPKQKDGDFKSVELWLKGGVPQRMRFEDPLGGASEVAFSAIRTNTKIDPGQFTFAIPKGTEVIEAEGRDHPER